MREKLARFMAGRNGNDQLNRFLLAADIILLLISGIFSHSFGRYLYPLVILLLGWAYFRMLSRNIYKRSEENGKYLSLKNALVSRARVWREIWVQRRDYKFFTCPACHSALRVPRGRGKIKIVCRKCGHSFSGKS